MLTIIIIITIIISVVEVDNEEQVNLMIRLERAAKVRKSSGKAKPQMIASTESCGYFGYDIRWDIQL